MPLSRTEIRRRATGFVKRWEAAHNEDADAKPFWGEFFEVFGVWARTLADLYDPLTMPPNLVKAHTALDSAVDKCYRKAPFTTEPQRVAYLFELYEKYTSGLLAGEKPRSRRSARGDKKKKG